MKAQKEAFLVLGQQENIKHSFAANKCKSGHILGALKW